MSQRHWRDELRATLSLAWPLMLANLTMQLIQATDVVLLGWLGPTELAAAALALSLSFGMILFAMGVLTAVLADDRDARWERGSTRCAMCGGPSASRFGRPRS